MVSAASPIVVILNGTSSAGKTSIARMLPTLVEQPMLYSGLDVVLMSMPFSLHSRPDGPSFETSVEGTVIRVGPTAVAMVRAWHQAQATLVRSGFSLVLDEAIVDEQLLHSLLDAFAGMSVWLVGVVCDEAVAVAREADRGDRHAGLARGLASIVHEGLEYDAVVDTTTASVEDVSNNIVSVIGGGSPTAFERLRRRRSAG